MNAITSPKFLVRFDSSSVAYGDEEYSAEVCDEDGKAITIKSYAARNLRVLSDNELPFEAAGGYEWVEMTAPLTLYVRRCDVGAVSRLPRSISEGFETVALEEVLEY